MASPVPVGALIRKLNIAAANEKARRSFEAGLFRLKMAWR